MVVSTPADKAEKMADRAGVVSATTEPSEGDAHTIRRESNVAEGSKGKISDESLTMAMAAWIAHFSEGRRAPCLRHRKKNKNGDASNCHSPLALCS